MACARNQHQIFQFLRWSPAALLAMAALVAAGGVSFAGSPALRGAGRKPAISAGFNPALLQRFVITPGSRLTLKGAATIGSWSGRSGHVQGTLNLFTSRRAITQLFAQIDNTPRHDPPRLRLPEWKPAVGSLAIPVTSLHGGSSGMDHDMWHALKAKAHPVIRYTFKRVLGASLRWNQKTRDPQLKLQVLGTLTLAGVTRPLRTDMFIFRRAAGRYTIYARSKVLMRDFGVTPPSAFFGLIRGHNLVRVIFDLRLVVH